VKSEQQRKADLPAGAKALRPARFAVGLPSRLVTTPAGWTRSQDEHNPKVLQDCALIG